MTTAAIIVRFPPAAVWLFQAREGGWLVLAPHDHGWIHGTQSAARADAVWLADNLCLAVREVRS